MFRMERSKFAGMEEKRYWTAISQEQQVKLVAKMFREITHIKPPRGRTGRQLDQTVHYCVETPTPGVYHQRQVTADEELSRLENKGNSYNNKYLPDEAKGADLTRLSEWHDQHQNLLKTQNIVRGLEDLVQGLMGLGLKNVHYEPTGYRRTKYKATLEMENFFVTVIERGADD